MHECLHVRNVSKLKGSIRPIAEAAAARSLQDLARLQSLAPELPNTQAVLLLPVVVANLDPSRIPAPHELDNLSTTSPMLQIDCAVVALLIFGQINHPTPMGACLDIWSHVWPWIDFVHIYWDALPAVRGMDKMSVTVMHAYIILSLVRCGPTHAQAVIETTRGVRRILAMAWKGLLDKDELWLEPGSLKDVGPLVALCTPMKGQRTDMEEIIEATGGDLENLASVLVKHVSRAEALPETPQSDLASFLRTGMDLFAHEHAILFHTAIRSFHLVPKLVAAILTLHGPPVGHAVDTCFWYLVEALKTPPGRTFMVQALRAGLLRCIVLFGGSPRNRAIRPGTAIIPTSELIAELLDEVLPRSLVHYRVVLQFQQSFPEVESLASSVKGNPAFSKRWQFLSDYVDARLYFLESWAEQSKQSFKGCDNALCGTMELRRQFKTCSTCHSVDYCSNHCQAIDWRDGHREVCKKLQMFHRQYPETLSTRGKCFMRALLTDDYLLRLPYVAMDQLLFMYEHPGQQFFTAFVYADAGSLLIRTEPAPSLEHAKRWDAHFPSHFARVKKSGGRMQIHVMVIYEGNQRRPLVFPSHADTSALHDGLRGIVQSLPPGLTADEVRSRTQKEVDSLAHRIMEEEEEGEVLYIH
ncbi:hypothetical protein DFH06DRAFT_1194130 [Mycena polygramma]|nr:hypothetical protein DFH06DRAFT_1194130 [Mycena polygramma]